MRKPNLTVSIGMAAGAAAIGAGVALLLAPQAGRRTRRQLRRTALCHIRSVREGITNKGSEIYEWGKEAADLSARKRGWGKKLMAA